MSVFVQSSELNTYLIKLLHKVIQIQYHHKAGYMSYFPLLPDQVIAYGQFSPLSCTSADYSRLSHWCRFGFNYSVMLLCSYIFPLKQKDQNSGFTSFSPFLHFRKPLVSTNARQISTSTCTNSLETGYSLQWTFCHLNYFVSTDHAVVRRWLLVVLLHSDVCGKLWHLRPGCQLPTRTELMYYVDGK